MGDFRNHTVRGCEPRGTVREHRQPLGRITNYLNTKTFVDADGVEDKGRVITRLVTVKTGCRPLRAAFISFCRRHGITWRVPAVNPVSAPERWYDKDGNEVADEQRIDDFKGDTTIVEVCGGAAVDKLFGCPFVVEDSETFTLNVNAPRLHSGERFVRSVSIRTPQHELFKGCPNVFVARPEERQ